MLHLPTLVWAILDILALLLFYIILFILFKELRSKRNFSVAILSIPLIELIDLHFNMASILLLPLTCLLLFKFDNVALRQRIINLAVTLLITLIASNLGGFLTITIYRATGMNWLVFSLICITIFSLIAFILILLYKKVMQLLNKSTLNTDFLRMNLSSNILILLSFLLVALGITRLLKIETKLLATILILFGILSFIILLTNALIFAKEIKNQELQHQKERNQDNKQYVHDLEKQYQNLRKAKHDYKNLLLAIATMANNNNTPKISATINELLDETTDDNVSFENKRMLQKIKDALIKSIIKNKIIDAEQQSFLFSLQIEENIPDLQQYSVVLTRVLGILLDNANEAAQESPRKEVALAIIPSATTIEFIIQNAITAPIDLDRIFALGTSTKGTNRGYGLSTVNDILSHYENIFLNVETSPTNFTVTLILETESVQENADA
ncbi:GHKL domain-containing protein [Loigolactobacillus binensis]|uniref:GHKL domain-containing protein n=1 Tax=Loigolactobacillus binensis TaxID=2559922 RepID=A0ABW3EHT3_9LACO|nr:GHKL domain-containing protein [Loigolactobacillus binensis]